MKKILALVLALCMVFALCACGSSSGDSDTPAASTVSLNVGTGGESGTYYGYTGILGTVIGQKTNVKLTVVATGGSKDNLVSMQDGMYDLATVQSDVMTYAYNGTNSFADSGKIDGFRVLCALYPETVQIVTTDPSLKTVEDLRGKRVCVGDVGSVVLRDRKHLAEDGMVVVVLPVSAQNGDLLAEPEIITRGFIYVKDSEELLQDLRNLTMSTAEAYRGKRGRDLNELKGAIRSAVSNYLFKATKRSPMVLPVITRL